MKIEFDPDKNKANIRKHGLSLEMALDIDITTAYTTEDSRVEYGERRFQMFGTIHGRVHIMIFTIRGHVSRIISLRKANDREVRRYQNARQSEKE